MSDLKHIGVLGMRWGRRKSSNDSDGYRRVGKPKGMSNKEFDREYEAEINATKSSDKKKSVVRLGKKKSQSDKDFDREYEAEIKATKADIESSKVYIKQYLKRAGGALVAGLVVAQAGKMLAESFINARNLERLESILKK